MGKKEGLQEQSTNKLDLLRSLADECNKSLGAEGKVYLGEDIEEFERIPVGILAFDSITGGGLVRKHLIELFGEESCVSKDTKIIYQVRSQDGGLQNSKGGTIENLYHLFHKIPRSGKGNYSRQKTKDSWFSTSSVNEEDRFFQNRIIDVVKCGPKKVFEVVTSKGCKLKATEEHKFYVGDRYVPLSDLKIGSSVMVHLNTPFKVEKHRNYNKGKKYVNVKSHPVACCHIIDGKYRYYKLAESRAVVEAKLNSLDFQDYIDRLNSHNLEGLHFLPRELHVHHVDEDLTNNKLENLLVISDSEHGKIHATERHNNLRFEAKEDVVVNITYIGIEDTYDIKMESPFNNYVANNIVVHNSGKTFIALHAVASVQKMGGVAVWVQGEEFDAKWAKKQGVDVDSLVRIQALTGDKALETAVTILEVGNPDLMVFDSYQALGTTREHEGGVDSESYAGGGAAQLWGRVYRRTRGAFNGGKATTALLGISQVRDAIGAYSPNGKPEPKPTQIRALKHWKAISVQCKKGEPIFEDPKSDKKKLVAREFHLKCVKNKTAVPERVSSFRYVFRDNWTSPPGIDYADEVVRLGKVYDLLEQKGSWLKGAGLEAQGSENFKQLLLNQPEKIEELRQEILKSI